MKGLTVKLLIKVAVPLLLGVQVLTVNAEENNVTLNERFRQELISEMKENVRLPKLEMQKLEARHDEQKVPQPEKKTVGYVSIISLIVSDALGRSNKRIRVRGLNEAGKISF